MITIAVADDERYVRENICERIRLSGVQARIVGTAADGGEAMALYQESAPDIFFVDINMPITDGLTFIEEVRRRYPHNATCFLVISGYDDFPHLRQSIRAGVADYIRKPILQQEFDGVIRAACRQVLEKRRDQERLVRSSGMVLYQELIKRERLPEGTKGILLRASGDLFYQGESPLAALSHEFSVRFPEGKVEFIAFPDAPSVCMVLLEGCGVSNKELERFAYRVSRGNGMDVVYGCASGEPAIVIGNFDDSLSLRLSSGNLLVQEKAVKTEGLQVNMEPLELLVEQNQATQLREWLDGYISLCRSGKRLLHLRELYHRVLVELLGLRSRHQLPLSAAMEKELQPFALGKYTSLPDIVEVLYGFAKDAGEAIAEKKKQKDVVDCVAEYLDRHYFEDISLKRLSNEFFVSAAYLSTRFREKTKIPLTQYLENIRMEKAREYLRLTGNSVSEIAQLVGYSDSSYFTRVFQKKYQITPRQYRQDHKKIR